MPVLKIRRASPEDARILGALHSACWRAAYQGIVPDEYLAEFTPEKRTAFFARILPEKRNENYLLSIGKTIVGMMAIGPALDKDLPAFMGEIQALYLLPAFWGKGYGRQAMAFAMERLRCLGYDEAALWVLTDNANARCFYDRYGFAPDGKEKPIMLGKELMEARYRMALGGNGREAGKSDNPS